MSNHDEAKEEREIQKEAEDLMMAILRLCAEADNPRSVLTALTFSMRTIGIENQVNDCCILYEMFKLYTSGVNGISRADLFQSMMGHFVEDGVARIDHG